MKTVLCAILTLTVTTLTMTAMMTVKQIMVSALSLPSIYHTYQHRHLPNQQQRWKRLPFLFSHRISSSALSSSPSSIQTSPSSSQQQQQNPPITIESLSCSHDGGSTYQLNEASYVLNRGANIGLVGRNGCGKSTLLNILADVCCEGSKSITSNSAVYTGKVIRARDCRVAFVEQDPPMPNDVTVADALLGILHNTTTQSSNNKIVINDAHSAAQAYRSTTINTDGTPIDQTAFERVSDAMDEHNGWEIMSRIENIAQKLRVNHLVDRTLDQLSGGERRRVSLATALVGQPDVLLLDEPTNHLDLAAIRWLSDLIQENARMTLLVVTHDRAFLEEVCDNILELDRGSLYAHPGKYSTFLENRSARFALEDATIEVARRDHKKELEWMRKQPKARESKGKARIDAFRKLEKVGADARSRQQKRNGVQLELSSDTDGGQRRMGGNVLKLERASLAFNGRTMLDDFSYSFNRGDRIGIVGANGVGKSTFIKVLTQQQPLDSGNIECGETVVFGMYDQKGIEIEGDQRVLEFVKERVEARDGSSIAESPQEAMRLLKRFQFQRDRWNERVSVLSGGEKRRLQLLSVLTKKPNFLVLDEPTNDVDLDTLAVLESYLQEFDGVLVVVTHDRFFADKVTEHLFVFEGDGVVKDYIGSLSDYADCLVEQERITSSSFSEVGKLDTAPIEKVMLLDSDKKVRMKHRNNLRNNQKEMDRLEPSIERLKKEAADVEIQIDESTDEGWTILAELTEKLNGINGIIDEKEERWLELAELLEEMEL